MSTESTPSKPTIANTAEAAPAEPTHAAPSPTPTATPPAEPTHAAPSGPLSGYLAGGVVMFVLSIGMSLALMGVDISREVVIAVGLGLAGVTLAMRTLLPRAQDGRGSR